MGLFLICARTAGFTAMCAEADKVLEEKFSKKLGLAAPQIKASTHTARRMLASPVMMMMRVGAVQARFEMADPEGRGFVTWPMYEKYWGERKESTNLHIVVF